MQEFSKSQQQHTLWPDPATTEADCEFFYIGLRMDLIREAQQDWD